MYCKVHDSLLREKVSYMPEKVFAKPGAGKILAEAGFCT